MGIGGAAGRQQPHGATICHQLTNQHIVLDRCTTQSGQKAKAQMPRRARLKKTNSSTKPDTLWLQIGTVMLTVSDRQGVLKLLQWWGQPSNTSASTSPQGCTGRARDPSWSHLQHLGYFGHHSLLYFSSLVWHYRVHRVLDCAWICVFDIRGHQSTRSDEMHFHTLEPLTEVTSPTVALKENHVFSVFFVFQFQLFGPSAGGWRSWILVSLATILK